MTDADRPRFAALLGGLGEAFNEPISDARLEIYFLALADLPVGDVQAAIAAVLRTQVFFPRPATIREAVHGRPSDLTETAWLSWRKAAKRIGGAGSVVFSDPALAETLVAMFGGWPGACYADFSDEMWAAKRKEFDRVYHVFAQRGLTGTRHLAGTQEQANGRLGEYTPLGFLDGLTVRALEAAERDALAGEPPPQPQPAQLEAHRA